MAKENEEKLTELVSIRVARGTNARVENLVTKLSVFAPVPGANIIRAALNLGLNLMEKHHEEITVSSSTEPSRGITRLAKKTIENGKKTRKGKKT